MRFVATAFLSAAMIASVQAAELKSVARIVDADSVYVAGQKIRLEGVDAPETDQKCLNAAGADENCGLTAKRRLEEFANGREWQCQAHGHDVYGRNLGTCMVGGTDIGRWLVRNGWALAFVRYSKAYVAEEIQAREQKLGLWAGAFVAPWDWRHRNPKTTVLGAVTVPSDAQMRLISPVSAAPPTEGCNIKGNLKSTSECIYHMPGQRYYNKLKMTPIDLRRWFCSEAEAQAAGCRISKI